MRSKILFLVFFLLFSFTNSLSFTVNSNYSPKTDDQYYSNIMNEKNIFSKPENPSIFSEEFGNQETFVCIDFINSVTYEALATLLAVGNYCYIYMANVSITSLNQSYAITLCEYYRDEFDERIYPKSFESFGSPDGILGDIDGDPKVTILVLPIDGGVTGYYYELNDRTDHPNSNRREMVYIDIILQPLDGIKAIAHEFNHLVFYNYDGEDSTFLAEGIAEYAIFYAGYLSNVSFQTYEPGLNLTDLSLFFMLNHQVSLFCWDRETFEIAANYGAAYMFMFYLAEKYGEDVLRQLLHSEELDGPQAVEDILFNEGYNVTFNELYQDWTVACLMDRYNLNNNLYKFKNLNFEFENIQEINGLSEENTTISLFYYGMDIKRFNFLPDDFTICIDRPRDPYSLGFTSIIKDQNGWNITSLNIKTDQDQINLYLSGFNIQYAYFITNLMKPGVPVAPFVWTPPPQLVLNFTMLEGHIPLPIETEESSYHLYVVFLTLLTTTLLVKIKKKKIKI